MKRKNQKRYNVKGMRLTDCCGAMSTYIDGDLCCKNCYRIVSIGEGDGNEFKPKTKETLSK